MSLVVPNHESAQVVPPAVMARAASQARSRGEAESDRQFVAMLRSFRETGGLARGDEVAELLVQRGSGDVSRLARWIVSREAIGFDWRGEVWVPLFQFELGTMTLRPEARQVAVELGAEFDAWGVAEWFSTPNVWLGERTPADALLTDLPTVLEAARADRFAVTG